MPIKINLRHLLKSAVHRLSLIMKHLRLKSAQSQQMLAALVLTGILSLGSSITFVNAATANSVGNSQDVTNLKQSRARQLPNSVVNAIRKDIARRVQSSGGQWKVVTFNPQGWPDGCLGLAQPGEVCTQMFIENGWRVVMSNGNQTLTYRTDATGRTVRLEGQKNPRRSDLPSSVANAVLQAASQQTGLRTSELRVVKSEQIETDGCLGLGRPDEGCPAIAIKAWEVTLEGGQQRLVYRSDPNGNQVRLNDKASTIRDAQLPRAVSNAVLQEASRQFSMPTSQLRIAKAEKQTWRNSCLDLERPTERCMGTMTPGWRVTVVGGASPLVFHTDDTGSRIRLNQGFSNVSDGSLPQSVADAVLREASQRTGLRPSQHRILLAKQIQGSSSCVGLPRPGEACTRDLAPLWLVIVEGGQQRLLYHANMDGSRIRLNEGASGIDDAKERPENPAPGKTITGVRIPANELPPPLPQNAIFRVITSGGFAGRTEEAVLLNNGQLIKRAIAPNGTGSTPQRISVSPERLEQFKRMLSMQSMAQFNGLSYPAPQGAADFMTVTITSKDGTTRYVDMVQDQLPKPLQLVMMTWNSMTRGR